MNPRLLEHGDQITLGDSVFLFLLREGEAPPAARPVLLSDDDLLIGLTVRMRREEAVYLDERKIAAVLPRETRTARHEAVKEAKKQAIFRACEQAGGSYFEAAKLLNVHLNNLYL